MTSQWNYVNLLVVIATCMWSYITTASPCDGSPEVLTVDYTPKRIFSPGYPSHYHNNLHCDWVFETIRNQSTRFGIQLTTLELELDAPYKLRNGKCNDSLEVFEGTPSSLGRSLGKWCGSMKHIIKTLSEHVTLRFLTDGYYVGKGFVIEYSLIRVASAECRPGGVTPVHVGRTPLYESFDVTDAEERWLSFPHADRCTWTMEAIDEFGHSDPNSALVIEAFSVPHVLCEVGRFIIFDDNKSSLEAGNGQDTNSSKVLEWCDNGPAFSKIYLSSNYATLTFVFKLGKKFMANVQPIYLKLYTKDTTYDCNDTHLPAINMGMDPVYFSLPLFQSPSGAVCSVHMSHHVKNKNSLRLEVMSVSGQEITCETDAVVVRSAFTNAEVKKLCNRQQYPMYLPQAHDLILSIRNKSAGRVYIRALTNGHYCGEEVQAKAYDDMIMEQTLPMELGLTVAPHNCHLRYLVTTNNKNRSISLHLSWIPNIKEYNIFTETDSCNGDFINVYDGNNESAPLLFSSCRKSDEPNNYIISRITGTEEKMLILFNTDDANEAKQATLKYYAVPVNIEDCKSEHKISVNTSIQRIISPNYPDFYPLDHNCVYVLTAAEGNVIVVEPEDTRFMSGCGDIINIYDGTSPSLESAIGRICGYDKIYKRFVSSTPKAVIRFSSDQFGSSGGWKLRVYSRRKMSGGIKTDINLLLAAFAFFISSRIALKL